MTTTAGQFAFNRRHILFDDDRKQRFLASREKLRYLPNGVQAEVAKLVGCTRQTVHNVLYDYSDDLMARSDFAYDVWRRLEEVVNRPEYAEEYKMMKTIADGLIKGSSVQLELPLPKYRLISRKLNKLGVKYTEAKERGWPNVYLLTPVKKEEPALAQ